MSALVAIQKLCLWGLMGISRYFSCTLEYGGFCYENSAIMEKFVYSDNDVGDHSFPTYGDGDFMRSYTIILVSLSKLLLV